MKQLPLPVALALCAFASLAFATTAEARCAEGAPLPSCVEATETSEDPGFDLTNNCGNFKVSVNVLAPDVDFTFTMGVDETMSELILSEIPSSDLENLTNAHKKGEVELLCCPVWSSRSHCSEPVVE